MEGLGQQQLQEVLVFRNRKLTFPIVCAVHRFGLTPPEPHGLGFRVMILGSERDL